MTFLMRGFAGDAMVVAMAHDAVNLPTSATSGSASSALSCHEAMQGSDKAAGKAGSLNHHHCQLCCAVIAIPSTALLTFDQAAFFARPSGFTPSFASNELLPAFKPPIR